MIYNNHVAYKVDLKPEDFAQLANEKNIVAVKESSHDSRRITDMINRSAIASPSFRGVDDLFLENALFGAVGWVSGLANSFPREAVQLYKLAKAGRTAEALELYRWFMPLLHLDVATKLVQYIKLANQMTGRRQPSGCARRACTLEGEERKRIAAIIQQAIDTPAATSSSVPDATWTRRRHRRRRHRRAGVRLQAVEAGGAVLLIDRKGIAEETSRGNAGRLRVFRHHADGDQGHVAQAAALAGRSARPVHRSTRISAADHAVAAALLARRLARPRRGRHQGAGSA